MSDMDDIVLFYIQVIVVIDRRVRECIADEQFEREKTVNNVPLPATEYPDKLPILSSLYIILKIDRLYTVCSF